MTSLHDPFKRMHVLIGLFTFLSLNPPRLYTQTVDSTTQHPMASATWGLIWRPAKCIAIVGEGRNGKHPLLVV
jgi:hypothetical protein